MDNFNRSVYVDQLNIKSKEIRDFPKGIAEINEKIAWFEKSVKKLFLRFSSHDEKFPMFNQKGFEQWWKEQIKQVINDLEVPCQEQLRYKGNNSLCHQLWNTQEKKIKNILTFYNKHEMQRRWAFDQKYQNLQFEMEDTHRNEMVRQEIVEQQYDVFIDFIKNQMNSLFPGEMKKLRADPLWQERKQILRRIDKLSSSTQKQEALYNEQYSAMIKKYDEDEQYNNEAIRERQEEYKKYYNEEALNSIENLYGSGYYHKKCYREDTEIIISKIEENKQNLDITAQLHYARLTEIETQLCISYPHFPQIASFSASFEQQKKIIRKEEYNLRDQYKEQRKLEQSKIDELKYIEDERRNDYDKIQEQFINKIDNILWKA